MSPQLYRFTDADAAVPSDTLDVSALAATHPCAVRVADEAFRTRGFRGRCMGAFRLSGQAAPVLLFDDDGGRLLGFLIDSPRLERAFGLLHTQALPLPALPSTPRTQAAPSPRPRKRARPRKLRRVRVWPPRRLFESTSAWRRAMTSAQKRAYLRAYRRGSRPASH